MAIEPKKDPKQWQQQQSQKPQQKWPQDQKGQMSPQVNTGKGQSQQAQQVNQKTNRPIDQDKDIE